MVDKCFFFLLLAPIPFGRKAWLYWKWGSCCCHWTSGRVSVSLKKSLSVSYPGAHMFLSCNTSSWRLKPLHLQQSNKVLGDSFRRPPNAQAVFTVQHASTGSHGNVHSPKGDWRVTMHCTMNHECKIRLKRKDYNKYSNLFVCSCVCLLKAMWMVNQQI